MCNAARGGVPVRERFSNIFRTVFLEKQEQLASTIEVLSTNLLILLFGEYNLLKNHSKLSLVLPNLFLISYRCRKINPTLQCLRLYLLHGLLASLAAIWIWNLVTIHKSAKL